MSQDGAFEVLLASGAGRSRSRGVLVELQAKATLDEGETEITHGSAKTVSGKTSLNRPAPGMGYRG